MVAFCLHCCWQQASCATPRPVTRCSRRDAQHPRGGLASQHDCQSWHAAPCEAQGKPCQQRVKWLLGAWMSTQLLRTQPVTAEVGCLFQGCCLERKASRSQHTSVELTGPPSA